MNANGLGMHRSFYELKTTNDMIKGLTEIRNELLTGLEKRDGLYIKMQVNKIDTLLYNASKNKCKHLNKKEVWREYPDAYIEHECLDCGERIFEDMYND